MIIYKAENKINGKIYIGQTKNDLSKRIASHVRSNSYIGRALRKYGLESFAISVIDHADTKEVINEKEKYWIKTLGSNPPNGYNLANGGEGGDTSRFVHYKPCTEETKMLISFALKGRPSPMKGKSHPFKGKKLSKEQKEHMRHPKSEQGRANIAAGAKNRAPASKETNKKISLANKISLLGNTNGRGGKGKVRSLETRKRISEAAKGRKSPMEGKKHKESSKKKISETRIKNIALRSKETTNTL